MPDGKPDLSGIWDNGRNTNIRSVEHAEPISMRRPREIAAEPRPLPEFLMRPSSMSVQASQTTSRSNRGPCELMKKRQADNSKENPDAHCLPMGFMQFHTHSQPRKIVQTRDVILIIYEANSGLRQIFTDGRPLPGKMRNHGGTVTPLGAGKATH